MKYLLPIIFAFNFILSQEGEVTNVVATQRTDGSQIVDITYDLLPDSDFPSFTVFAYISLDEGETFEQASVELKSLLEKSGYNYNEVKTEHVFFVTGNGNTTLNWNTAVALYYLKKQPKEGDYFFIKKFLD